MSGNEDIRLALTSMNSVIRGWPNAAGRIPEWRDALASALLRLEAAERVWQKCRVTYYPPAKAPDYVQPYPIEHSAAAGKIGRAQIEAALKADANADR